MGDLTLAVAWATFLRLVCAGGVPLILRRDREFFRISALFETAPRSSTLWAVALVAGVGIVGDSRDARV
jgi:hypothetical protein